MQRSVQPQAASGAIKRDPSAPARKFVPTRPCLFFAQGHCRNGDQCTFLHPAPSVNAPVAPVVVNADLRSKLDAAKEADRQRAQSTRQQSLDVELDAVHERLYSMSTQERQDLIDSVALHCEHPKLVEAIQLLFPLTHQTGENPDMKQSISIVNSALSLLNSVSFDDEPSMSEAGSDDASAVKSVLVLGMLSCWFADTLHAFDSLLALSPFTSAMTSAMKKRYAQLKYQQLLHTIVQVALRVQCRVMLDSFGVKAALQQHRRPDWLLQQKLTKPIDPPAATWAAARETINPVSNISSTSTTPTNATSIPANFGGHSSLTSLVKLSVPAILPRGMRIDEFRSLSGHSNSTSPSCCSEDSIDPSSTSSTTTDSSLVRRVLEQLSSTMPDPSSVAVIDEKLKQLSERRRALEAALMQRQMKKEAVKVAKPVPAAVVPVQPIMVELEHREKSANLSAFTSTVPTATAPKAIVSAPLPVSKAVKHNKPPQSQLQQAQQPLPAAHTVLTTAQVAAMAPVVGELSADADEDMQAQYLSTIEQQQRVVQQQQSYHTEQQRQLVDQVQRLTAALTAHQQLPSPTESRANALHSMQHKVLFQQLQIVSAALQQSQVASMSLAMMTCSALGLGVAPDSSSSVPTVSPTTVPAISSVMTNISTTSTSVATPQPVTEGNPAEVPVVMQSMVQPIAVVPMMSQNGSVVYMQMPQQYLQQAYSTSSVYAQGSADSKLSRSATPFTPAGSTPTYDENAYAYDWSMYQQPWMYDMSQYDAGAANNVKMQSTLMQPQQEKRSKSNTQATQHRERKPRKAT